MQITIDVVADAATVQWGERARGRSKEVTSAGKGVRLLLNASGDVVGMEILGWSGRTSDTTDIQLSVHGAEDAQLLTAEDPLARALASAAAAAPRARVDRSGRPTRGGRPMIPATEAAQILGLDRSWLNRLMNGGKLRAEKIGGSWWTTQKWIDDFERRPAAAR